MVPKPTRFHPPSGLEALSPEARRLVLEARAHLDRWIDENVDRLEQELQAGLAAQRGALEVEVASVCEELAAGREKLGELLAGLKALDEGFSAGDGVTVERAARETRDAVEAVRRSLEERERRVRGLARALAADRPAGRADS